MYSYTDLLVVDPELEPYPQQLTTALFSFLYHLASYENGQLKKHLFPLVVVRVGGSGVKSVTLIIEYNLLPKHSCYPIAIGRSLIRS